MVGHATRDIDRFVAEVPRQAPSWKKLQESSVVVGRYTPLLQGSKQEKLSGSFEVSLMQHCETLGLHG